MKIYRIATTFGGEGWIISRHAYPIGPSNTHAYFVMKHYDSFNVSLNDIQTAKDYCDITKMAILKSNAVRYCVGFNDISLESTMQGLKLNIELIRELQDENPSVTKIYVDTIFGGGVTDSETFNDIQELCDFLGL